jgi:hypothetical protein
MQQAIMVTGLRASCRQLVSRLRIGPGSASRVLNRTAWLRQDDRIGQARADLRPRPYSRFSPCAPFSFSRQEMRRAIAQAERLGRVHGREHIVAVRLGRAVALRHQTPPRRAIEPAAYWMWPRSIMLTSASARGRMNGIISKSRQGGGDEVLAGDRSCDIVFGLAPMFALRLAALRHHPAPCVRFWYKPPNAS